MAPEGVRVTVIGFGCANHQHTPVTTVYVKQSTSLADLEAAFDKARQVKPNGGTCPGDAIELVVADIEATKQYAYPYAGVILVTDGVFYDMPCVFLLGRCHRAATALTRERSAGAARHPKVAETGLAAYGAARFAIGIAIPLSPSDKGGLSPADLKTQKTQLTSFVGGDLSNIFSIDASGFDILGDIATEIAVDLPAKFPLASLTPRGEWCGWRKQVTCLSKKDCKWKQGAGLYGCSPAK